MSPFPLLPLPNDDEAETRRAEVDLTPPPPRSPPPKPCEHGSQPVPPRPQGPRFPLPDELPRYPLGQYHLAGQAGFADPF